MRTTAFRVVASSWLLTSLLACPPPVVECIDGTEDVCDAGGLPPDFCNSKEEAVSDAVNCHFTITSGGAMPARREGLYLSRLSDGGVDQDWYYAEAPGGLSARSLLHISGGYAGVTQTAVNFSINVLKEGADGKLTSVATGIDRHGAAAPKNVDIIVPFGESNAKLFVLAADEGVSGQVRVDNRNTYGFYLEVLDNPDSNEPNDTTPTAIPLSGSPAQGMGTGYLATNDDVDLFTFNVPAGGRQIIYLRILGPDPHPVTPPPPYRLAYTLFDPSDVPVAEGVMANEFLRIDLATARLAATAGAYKLKVQGYKPPNTSGVIKGDLRIQYNVDLRLYPDVDTQEGASGNDTIATAKAVSLGGNSRQSLTGKLSYVADEEWFRVSLPARGSPATLRYRVTTAMGGGRFEPLSSTPTRQIRFFQRVNPGVGTAQDRLVACRTNRTACPRADDADPMFLDNLCAAADPPLCLYSQRTEDLPILTNLRNLVGSIPVAPNQATEYLVMFRDEGLGASKYADDRDWTLELEFNDDADEASRVGGPTMMTVGGTPTVASGELTYGYGLWADEDYFDRPDAIRARADYDAYDTDKDTFQFGLNGATGDQGWEVSWELQHPDGGTEPPGELALELTFCGAGGAGDGGLCGGAQRRIFTYTPRPLTPWYLPLSLSNDKMLFSLTTTPTTTTITALPVGCWCFSAPRVAAGQYFITTAAFHRTDNAPLRYRITQRVLPYPSPASCPVTDGGCNFAP